MGGRQSGRARTSGRQSGRARRCGRVGVGAIKWTAGAGGGSNGRSLGWRVWLHGGAAAVVVVGGGAWLVRAGR